ncbi:MAG: ribosome recycling factor [Burkholderiaceae bacterium]
MSIAEISQASEAKMLKSIESLKLALTKIRTGRASTGILDHVQVEYYGSMVPVSQVANVTLIDSRTVGVTAWEKNMTAVIDKAIRESDLGLNPAAMGDLLRVPMPPLSEERRKELTKVVRNDGEQAKVAVRNLRRDANDQFKRLVKDKEVSEDEERRGQESVQKLTDRSIAEIDKIIESKEQEIMTV